MTSLVMSKYRRSFGLQVSFQDSQLWRNYYEFWRYKLVTYWFGTGWKLVGSLYISLELYPTHGCFVCICLVRILHTPAFWAKYHNNNTMYIISPYNCTIVCLIVRFGLQVVVKFFRWMFSVCPRCWLHYTTEL